MAITAQSHPGASALLSAVLIFVAHNGVNTLLLSPLNPLRCLYWNRDDCTKDESWMLNWLSYSHFHVTVLLVSMVVSSVGDMDQEASLAYLTSSLILAYLIEGIFSLDLLHPSMAALQGFVYIPLLISIVYFSREAGDSTLKVGSRKNLDHASAEKRSSPTIAIPTLTVGLVSALSMFRVIDMTFGFVRMAYLGDTSSIIYQNISNLSVADMLITTVLLVYSLRFGTREQHRSVLVGQATCLLVGLMMLAGSQGEQISFEQVRAGGIGMFFSIVVALVGAL